jgi:hypothetical protein
LGGWALGAVDADRIACEEVPHHLAARDPAVAQAQRAQEVSDGQAASPQAAYRQTATPRAAHHAAAFVLPAPRFRLSASVFARRHGPHASSPRRRCRL